MDKIVSLQEGTCTHRAINHLISVNEKFANYEIIYVHSFDEGIEWMKHMGSRNDIILVPSVADEYKKIVTDAEFKEDTKNSFWYKNPPLYLAKRHETIELITCATLPVLTGLVSENLQFVYTRNTQESARVCNEGVTNCCITNQYGLENNKLEVIKQLKNFNVIWIPFSLA